MTMSSDFEIRRAFFDQLVWKPDRMLLNNLVFRLGHYKGDDWDLGDNCFVLYKIKPLIDQYARFWSLRLNFRAKNVLELGIWDGGSIAYWFEYLRPLKHVGIDLCKREDGDYFRQYVGSNGLEERIKTYWGTDQADSDRLREICKTEFSTPLDLVIDDASHVYEPTKICFETLFPLLRPGGLYIIEDWAWGHWKEFQSPHHPMANLNEPTALVVELMEATGTSTTLIAAMSIFQGFVVIERGAIEATKLEQFKLDDYISRRRPSSRWQKNLQRAKRLLRRIRDGAGKVRASEGRA